MRKRLEIKDGKEIYKELKELYKKEKEARIKTRYLVLLYCCEGYTSLEIGKLVKQSDATVRKYIHRYNKNGLNGLRDIPHPKVGCKVNDKELEIIDKVLQGKPSDLGLAYSNWTGYILRNWIRQNFGKNICLASAYNIFHKLKYSKTRAKKLNKTVNQETLIKFRKRIDELITNKDKNTVILYQDEAIITSEPTATAVWSKIGTQVIVKTQGGTRKRKVIFGAVNPENGVLVHQISDSGNIDNFKSFLK